MSKGYIIGNFTVKDAESYETYATAAKDFVEANGGTFLVRGGDMAIAEGESNSRIVVAEFDSYAEAQEVASGVLNLATSERGGSGEGSMVVVEGV